MYLCVYASTSIYVCAYVYMCYLVRDLLNLYQYKGDDIKIVR
jgi:hypothetical protein